MNLFYTLYRKFDQYGIDFQSPLEGSCVCQLSLTVSGLVSILVIVQGHARAPRDHACTTIRDDPFITFVLRGRGV